MRYDETGWSRFKRLPQTYLSLPSEDSIYSEIGYWMREDRQERYVTVLDVGCCAGHGYSILRQLLPEMFYVGVDITKDYIDTAKALWPDTHFEVADARKLTAFKDSEFDYVLLCDVLMHMDDDAIEQTIKACARVARKTVFVSGFFGEPKEQQEVTTEGTRFLFRTMSIAHVHQFIPKMIVSTTTDRFIVFDKFKVLEKNAEV